MPRRTTNPSAPFQTIPRATEITGLSQRYLRDGVKAGSVPHVRSGSVVLINVPSLLRKLGATPE